jgi:transposase
MPQTYSDDLRRKFLDAYEAGRGTLRELATQFGVSFGYGKKIRGQQLQTGRKERPVQARHGPASRVTAEVQQFLRSALRQQPDLTLLELQQRTEQARGVWLSRSLLWLWLRRLGLRHKKNRSGRKNKRARKISGDGRRGGSR